MPITLTERERSFLEFLGRYRISIPSINTVAVCDGSESAAKKLILHLRDFVASDPLGAKSVYYRLTPAGAKYIGVPEELARPLGPQALPRALGIVAFCCAGNARRERFTRKEFIDAFPELAKDLLGKDHQTDFFLDHDGTQARIGQIVIDQGGDYRKLISKCRVKLREYLDIRNIRDIVSEGLFTYAIVVAEEEKAKAIEAALKEKPLRARVIVETSAELQKCPIQVGGDE